MEKLLDVRPTEQTQQCVMNSSQKIQPHLKRITKLLCETLEFKN